MKKKEEPKRLRCHLNGVGTVNVEDIDADAELFVFGKEIEVDINILVENIYVCPTAPDWFVDIVKSIVGKYEFDFNVNKSSLYEGPVY